MKKVDFCQKIDISWIQNSSQNHFPLLSCYILYYHVKIAFHTLVGIQVWLAVSCKMKSKYSRTRVIRYRLIHQFA